MISQNERGFLAGVIDRTARYFGKKLEPDVISMMIDDLADLPVPELETAFARYRRDPKNKFYPMPAAIRELVEPQENDDSQARVAVARVVEAVSRFGYYGGADARAFVGELGWSIVKAYGGWSPLCEALGHTLDVSQFQAQARELAKSHSSLSRAGKLGQAPALPSPHSSKGGAVLSGIEANQARVFALIETSAEQRDLASNAPIPKPNEPNGRGT